MSTATHSRAQSRREQRIPGTLLYYTPQECAFDLDAPLRCDTDPRWRWPQERTPLSWWQRFRYERALARRIRTWRREGRV